MLSLFTKGKATLGEPKKFEFEEESDLFKDSKIPKIDMKELYGVGILDFATQRSFRKIEMTISATKAQTDCFLIPQARIDTARSEGFDYLHIGAVQVAFKFRSQQELGGGGASIVAVLGDNRFLIFEQGRMAAVQTDLNNNEIAYFSVIPYYPVAILDAREALLLTIKTHAKGLEENVEGLAVGYRVYYRLTKFSPFGGETRHESRGDFTNLFQTHHPKNHTFRKRRVEWKDIEFPDEWKNEGTKRTHESKEMGSSHACAPQSQQGSNAMQGQNDNLENARCQLLHWYNFDLEEVVAEGKIASVDPSAKVHDMPVGRDCCKVWVEEVSNENVNLYRPADEARRLGEALGSTVAWPKSSIKLL